MKKINKKKVKSFFIDIFFILVACSIGAFSTVSVMIPNGLTSGGLTGLVRIIQNYVNIDFSLLYYGGSVIILIVVVIFLGLREARKILLITVLYPAVLFLFELLPFELLEEKDVILAAIFCGVFSGACSGLVFWRGYSFCGTDAIAKIIKRRIFPEMSLSKILLVLDATIIIGSAFIFGRNIALYALVTQVIISKTVDFVMYGFETKIVQLEIITEQYKDVADYIMNELERGVSEEIITGSYTGVEKKKLTAICSPRESILIRRHIAEVDKRAFVTVIHVDTVWGNGEGFGDINKE